MNTTPRQGSDGRRQCVLCGDFNHTSIKGCRKMLDDKGNSRMVIPTFSKCTKCYEQTGKSLFHPPSFCMLRDNYPNKRRSQDNGSR